MSFSKMIAGVFGIVFIIILYVIIYFALKIMYKDVKNGGKRRRPAAAVKGNYGLEILNSGEGKDLKAFLQSLLSVILFFCGKCAI